MATRTVFTDRFTDFLSECLDDHQKQHYLLAVSGGVDSMVMLHLFHKVGLSFEVAHCNFGLRGEASGADETFVVEKAGQLGVKSHTKRFDTAALAKERGISTQMAARDLRYEWFLELKSVGRFDFIAIAHHRNDHAETVLFNLSKGTGIAGLHGIRPVTGQLVRPLLAFSRDEIEAFAQEEGIQWREDGSNQSNKYSRNLIRNEVVPLLKQINPSLEQSIWHSSQRIAAVESWLANEVDHWKEKLVKRETDVVFMESTMLGTHPHRALILSEIIRPFGFSYTEVEDIVDDAKRRSGRRFSNSEYDLVCDRDRIVITPKKEEQENPVVIEGEGEFVFLGIRYQVRIIKREDWKLQRTNDVLQADPDKIKWPLTLRTWQEGDSIQPLGMKGRKKVSDILIDEKLPLNLKSKQMVLEDQSDILWLPGMKMSQSYKVSSSTKKVLLIAPVVNIPDR
ncbi:MAG: tRNA lysidine(34) synthetase TilS [Cyclobacteriaceae bacterium]